MIQRQNITTGKMIVILIKNLKVYEMIQLHPQVALATGSSTCKGFLARAALLFVSSCAGSALLAVVVVVK